MGYKIFFTLLLIIINMNVVYGAVWNGSLINVYTDSSGAGNIDLPFKTYLLGNALIVSASSGDSITILNVSNPASITVISTTTSSAGVGTLDGARDFSIDDRNLLYISASVDNSFSIYNITKISSLTAISTYTISNPPFSLANAWGCQVEKRGTDYYLYVTSFNNDSISVFNVTNPLAITNMSNYTNSANPCSVDGATNVILDTVNMFAFVTSEDDNTITTFNISNPKAITCLSSYSDTSSPYSIEWAPIDGYNTFMYNNYMFTAGYTDNEFAIFSINSTGGLEGVGSYVNATKGAVNSLLLASSVFVYNDIAYVSRTGNRTATVTDGGVTVFNVSNKTNPVYVGQFNGTSGACLQKFSKFPMVVDNTTLYSISSNDDCLYIARSFNAQTITNQCIYSGSGDFNQTDTTCNITSNVVISGGNWNFKNSTVWCNSTVTGGNQWHWYSGVLRFFKW